MNKYFENYESKPIIRKAFKVTDTSLIIYEDAESTSAILIGNEEVTFKHYEPVKEGDYIVYLNDEDIYHCSKEVFEERNIV